MSENLMEVKHLKKYFETPKGMLHAVDDVTFSIGKGKTMGVVGESGCGKSTLGRTLIHLYESTDGQIFLESDLFFSGMRPAVNVGLSVSRVGGAAQTKAMKKASGTIRIDLAQYREMEVFTQFSSDLDDTTKEQLQYGKGLMELLKQPLCHPMSLADQVITLVAANKRLLLDVETAKTKEFQLGMLDFFHTEHMEIVNELNEKKVLDDTITEQIVEAVKEYKSR